MHIAIANPRFYGACLLAFLPAFHPAPSAESRPGTGRVTPLERIAIRTTEFEAQFYGKETREPFVARGFNYIRLRSADGKAMGDHSTFDADTSTTRGCYEPERAEAMFLALSQAGYNTVRVFLIGRSRVNPGIAGDYETTRGIHAPYMDNFLDFLRRATRHRIRVLPALGDGELPRNAHYRKRLHGGGYNLNATILTREGVAARVEHVTAVVSHVKTNAPELLPTLLGVQLQNEACLHANQWPFSETNGTFVAANGRSYDLADGARRQALMDEGYEHYHGRLVEAVRAIDPELLLAEGVFVPRAVDKDPGQHAGLWPGKNPDDRHPPTLLALGRGRLDFLDVHFYRTDKRESVDEAFRLNLGSTGLFTPELAAARRIKPVILGEFGAFEHVESSFAEAVQGMARVRDLANRERLNGLLYWTYDCHEQPGMFPASTDWPLFVRTMGNFSEAPHGTHPGAIKPGKP